jgi:flagellar protein FlaG
MSTIASVSPASTGGAGGMINRAAPQPIGNSMVSHSSGGAVQVVSEKISSTKAANAPTVQESAAISKESVRAAAEKLKTFVSSMNRDLSIDVDASSGRAIIKVVDPNSNETIRQIPGDEAIRLARTIDFLSSIFVNQKA